VTQKTLLLTLGVLLRYLYVLPFMSINFSSIYPHYE